MHKIDVNAWRCRGAFLLKTFLKPLTAEEEHICLEQWEEGDFQARDVLIERNMRLVAHVAKKYISSERDSEDLISIGTIGLIKAVNTFSMGKGSRLATYAAKCIDNEILMMLRSEKKNSRVSYLSSPANTDDEGNTMNLIDKLEMEDADVLERVTFKDDVRRMYEVLDECLKEKEKKVICMRYGLFGTKEFTQREIAEDMGISRSYVSRIEKAALVKLKDRMK